MAQQQPDVESVDFSACPRVTDRGKLALVSACSKIVADLNMFEVMNDELLIDLAKTRPAYSGEFNLLNCELVTDEGLAGLVAACPKVHPNDIKSLVKGEKFIAAVGQHHADLTEIALSDCKNVTDQLLAHLVVNCPKLSPDAIDSLQKGEAFVAAVSQHRPSLMKIDLTKCSAVTEEGLALLVEGCPQLPLDDIHADCKGQSISTKHLCFWKK